MSSPYLEWKYKDVTPEEPRRLTKIEQLKNWWHYHKLPLLLAVLLLFIAGGILKSALHIGEILPDMQVAYVGEHPLPTDTVAAVEQAFDAFATDANRDGRTVVRLVQYVSGSAEDADAVRQSTAASVALLADLEDRDSYFFLLEDAARFQLQYDILRTKDDALTDCFYWRDCPALSALSLGSYREEVLGTEITGDSGQVVSGLYLARRRFAEGREAKYTDACEALWQALTKGAMKP